MKGIVASLRNVFGDPKTTILGLFAILSAIVNYFLPEYLPQLNKVAAILAGLGLMGSTTVPPAKK